MGTMSVMGQPGDTKIIWDRNNRDEVENARRTFNDLVAKHYLAFEVTGNQGDKGKQIREFNPDAERLILAPPMRGGGA